MQTPIKILIVEDEIIVAMEIEFALQSSGFNVVGKASNSQKALELAEKFLPDVILMDINIKGNSNGIETALDIFKFHKPAVIFVSAYSDKETMDKLKKVQPHFYLSKPYTHSELKEKIAEALSGITPA